MIETSKRTPLQETEETPTPSRGRGRPISIATVAREEARLRGDRTYIGGLPCKGGHITERYTATGACIACAKINAKAKYDADPKAACQKVKDAYAADVEKARARARALYQKNPEKARESLYAYRVRAAVKFKGNLSHEPATCGICRETKDADSFAKDKYRSSGRKGECRVCVAAKWQKFRASPNYDKRQVTAQATRRKLKEENPKRRWAVMARNAANNRTRLRKDGPSDLTVDWLYDNAPTHCPMLGIPLRYERTVMGFDSAAVDRIDNTIGYRQSNCWIISAKANRIKTDATLEELELAVKGLRAMMDARAFDLV